MKKIFLAFMTLTLTGCFTSSKQPEAAAGAAENPEEIVEKVDAARAAQVGRAIAAEIFRKYPAVQDKATLEYANRVGQYVALHLNATEKTVKCAANAKMMKPKGLYVAVIKAADLGEAFSAPGGYVFLPTGLVAKLRSEDQLAGVIAHEYMHTMCGEDMPSNLAAAPGEIVTELLQRAFTKEQLIAADRGAVVALYRAGYYPTHYGRHVYENEETTGKHSGGKSRWGYMHKDISKLSAQIQKTTDARRARYEKFQRGVLVAASKTSAPGLN